MSAEEELNDYMVLSCGQWDVEKSSDEIQGAIDRFYTWYQGLVAEGRVKTGNRLAPAGKVVSKLRIADGPFAETKELIGGYWIVRARSLDEAAELMSHNPTLACGLWFQVRPIEHKRASAYDITTETPARR